MVRKTVEFWSPDWHGIGADIYQLWVISAFIADFKK